MENRRKSIFCDFEGLYLPSGRHIRGACSTRVLYTLLKYKSITLPKKCRYELRKLQIGEITRLQTKENPENVTILELESS